MSTRRKTRIVATIGPASRSPEILEGLLRAGVDVCRINCSHSSAESIRADISRIRRTATLLGRTVGILLDLQGPKIRTGVIEPPLRLGEGDVLTVVMDPRQPAVGTRIGTSWPTMADDVEPGEQVLFADGALSGTIIAVRRQLSPAEIDIRIVDGGVLSSRKGINLPNTTIKAPALTEKDTADLLVGVAAGADFVALSFVRSAADVQKLREVLATSKHPDTPIIAKIEKPEAVRNIEEILEGVDGIMVARGDLGVEIPLERVPVVQKELINAANQRGRLVITATQMLDSMERNPRPTRAETTDVANAILDGTDAVMLSGETASGEYPIRAVEVMDRIAREAEGSAFHHPPRLSRLTVLSERDRTVVRAACYAVREHARPLVVFTWSGQAAILASKSRPKTPIIALTPYAPVCDRLRLVWGVTALQVPEITSTDDLIAAGEEALMRAGLVKRGEEIVVLAGRSPLRGASNLMKIEVVDGIST
jgi:pyruvate kinase